MGIDPCIEASHRWMNVPCRRALPPSERLRRLPLRIALSRDNPVSDALLCRAITAGKIEGRIAVGYLVVVFERRLLCTRKANISIFNYTQEA